MRRGLFSSAKLNTKQLFKFGTVPALYPLLPIHAPRAGCDAEKIERKRTKQNFNPRTPCGVRRNLIGDKHFTVRISIHAPRAGCDTAKRAVCTKRRYFNPRTPCGVRRNSGAPRQGFQPHFNPRTPCGVRLYVVKTIPRKIVISIHAPRAGCDSNTPTCLSASSAFQSTHPVRGATFRH